MNGTFGIDLISNGKSGGRDVRIFWVPPEAAPGPGRNIAPFQGWIGSGGQSTQGDALGWIIWPGWGPDALCRIIGRCSSRLALALKGPSTTAQGNALGFRPPRQTQALKGRDRVNAIPRSPGQLGRAARSGRVAAQVTDPLQ
jgi:hypothetical protein